MISTGSGILRRTLQSCNASLQKTHIQRLSTKANVPPRKTVLKEERTALRQARRQQAVQSMEGSANTSSKAAPAAPAKKPIDSRIAFGLGVGVPTALLAWGIADEESPPAQLAKMIGLTGLIEGYGDTFARPSRDKLLPDWPMPNVPADMPAPHTLVLDLENTLVNATWDRKYGWRFAKRPGVGKFLTDMAQYYEIVIYSPSIDGVAEEVVNKLDKDGAVMHRLYRDACYYKKGVYMKDLEKLNRNTNRIVYIDDDYESAKLNPNNHIKIKPYDDPTDREDNSLERITPFLIEIAKEGYNNVPLLLKPYNDDGMDSDDIATEHERRVAELREMRMNSARRGLGAFSGTRNMPAPEMTPVKNRNAKRTAGPTAKDLVGSAPAGAETTATGVAGWMQRRQVEQAEENQRKMEYWNEVMLKKQQEKAAASQN
mmetsp:Transcript_688/g.1084  ORF Transcript_688/g.1084 Transcript_688/m.1084 type:complete len:429 (-) Transcript_688:76-1362(-)